MIYKFLLNNPSPEVYIQLNQMEEPSSVQNVKEKFKRHYHLMTLHSLDKNKFQYNA